MFGFTSGTTPGDRPDFCVRSDAVNKWCRVGIRGGLHIGGVTSGDTNGESGKIHMYYTDSLDATTIPVLGTQIQPGRMMIRKEADSNGTLAGIEVTQKSTNPTAWSKMDIGTLDLNGGTASLQVHNGDTMFFEVKNDSVVASKDFSVEHSVDVVKFKVLSAAAPTDLFETPVFGSSMSTDTTNFQVHANANTIVTGVLALNDGADTNAFVNGNTGDARFGLAAQSLMVDHTESRVALTNMDLQVFDVDVDYAVDPVFRVEHGSGDCYGNSFYSSGNVLVSSDRALKDNIEEVSRDKCYELVAGLMPFTYNLRKKPEAGEQLGYIAQNVQHVHPSLVQKDAQGMLSVDYGRSSAMLGGAVNGLIQQVRGLVAEVQALKESNAALRQEMEALRQ
jgi:hypothetical protein